MQFGTWFFSGCCQVRLALSLRGFCDKNGNVTEVPHVEHVPPDVTARIFWPKNRDPEHWRDSQQLEHVLGRYIISDQPMTVEQWARERATVIDEKPIKLVEGK
jgi:hypothetical protein